VSTGERDPQPRPAAPVHWLSRPETIRRLWVAFAVVLALSVAIEALVHMHPRFRIEGWFGFHAGYGFLACVGMVLFAKGLGFLVKRPDDYYPGASPPAADEERGRD
jgi:hypothetical protein